MEIERVHSIKYLGVHLDAHLSWSVHVAHVCSRIAGAIGAISKIQFLPTKVLRIVYYAIIHPGP